MESAGGGGSGSERKREDWRVVGGEQRGEGAPESFHPVTSLALVPGCAALRSRLSRNHLPTVETRASAVRCVAVRCGAVQRFFLFFIFYDFFFYGGFVHLFQAACFVPNISELFYALCVKKKG